MLPSTVLTTMFDSCRTDLYFGLFRWERRSGAAPELSRTPEAPRAIPDPVSGRLLRVATVEAKTRAECPACRTTGVGGYVSFVADLRLAYACPSCEELVWLAGA